MNHAVLRDAEVATQLMGGDALFMTADEAHRDEPFPQGNLGVLKDGSDGHGEINHRRIFGGHKKYWQTASPCYIPNIYMQL